MTPVLILADSVVFGMDANVLSAIGAILSAIVAILALLVAALSIWLGARQIKLFRHQLQFDAMLRLYERADPLWERVFTDDRLWRMWAMGSEPQNDIEKELLIRYAQQWCNIAFLDWKAKKHGMFEKEEWEARTKDAEHGAAMPGGRGHWIRAKGSYPAEFQEWYDERVASSKELSDEQLKQWAWSRKKSADDAHPKRS